jgi:hypothetical protein
MNALSSQLLFEQVSALKEKQTSITLEKFGYCFGMYSQVDHAYEIIGLNTEELS